REIVVGSNALMHDRGLDVATSLIADGDREQGDDGRTSVYIAVDGTVVGVLALADPIKESSREAIRRLHAMQLDVVMLTGDNAATAEAVARDAGIDSVVAGVLPDGKVAEIRRLQSKGK